MPSAEMEDDATFMITNNLLNKNYTPKAWSYNTFGYAFDVTLWGRLEIAYSLTLFNGKWAGNQNSWFFNQDRHFSAKLRLLRDGEFGQKWIPDVAIGTVDPVTAGLGGHAGGGGDYIDGNIVETGNGYFNRYYIVVSKNFNTSWGKVGGHVGYQYAFRMPKGPQAAVTWEPVWLNKEGSFLSSFRATLEYDARFVNFGINASIWKDHFEFMAMLLNMQYPMVGLRFKLRLAH